MSIETVKLSEKAKGQLVLLKRRTGIENWNVLCRWALMLSLEDGSKPAQETITTDSNVEMSWKVFGGDYADLYMAMLQERAHEEGQSNLNECLKLHLHRGISFAVNRIDNLDGIFSLLVQEG